MARKLSIPVIDFPIPHGRAYGNETGDGSLPERHYSGKASPKLHQRRGQIEAADHGEAHLGQGYAYNVPMRADLDDDC